MRRLTVALALALALASACIFVASCSSSKHPPVAAGALDGALLSIAEIEITMNAQGIAVNGTSTEMSDDSPSVPDKDCRFIDFPAETSVYNGSGWTAVRPEWAARAGELDRDLQRHQHDRLHQAPDDPVGAQLGVGVSGGAGGWCGVGDGARVRGFAAVVRAVAGSA